MFITLNNFFTAANGIYTKKKMDSMTFGEYDILNYNSILTLFPMLFVTFYLSEIDKVKKYSGFKLFCFLA
jgi:hypothetical protein